MEVSIVVSGIPASGKSTIGRELASHVGIPLVDKDDFLEAVFLERPVLSPDERRRASRRADELFMAGALESAPAVLVSHWRHPASLQKRSGTPTDWLVGLTEIVEVHCLCPPTLAATRFVERKRHLSHGDPTVVTDTLIGAFTAQAELGPLGFSAVVSVNTAVRSSVPDLIERIRAAAAGPGDA